MQFAVNIGHLSLSANLALSCFVPQQANRHPRVWFPGLDRGTDVNVKGKDAVQKSELPLDTLDDNFCCI